MKRTAVEVGNVYNTEREREKLGQAPKTSVFFQAQCCEYKKPAGITSGYPTNKTVFCL